MIAVSVQTVSSPKLKSHSAHAGHHLTMPEVRVI